MLSSSCSILAWSLRSVKFLSRLLTALNLLPSIATMPSLNIFSRRHSRTNSLQTLRIASPLSRRKSANSLEVRCQAPGQPDQFQVALRFGLQASAGLHPVEVAVDIDLEQRRRVVCRSTRHGRLGPIEAQLPQIEFVDERIDDSNGAVLVDPVVQPLREESVLRSIFPFDISPHRSPPSIRRAL